MTRGLIGARRVLYEVRAGGAHGPRVTAGLQ